MTNTAKRKRHKLSKIQKVLKVLQQTLLALSIFFAISIPATPALAKQAPSIGVWPPKVLYPPHSHWISLFIQEELSFQFQQSRRFWVRSPHTLRLWKAYRAFPKTNASQEAFFQETQLNAMIQVNVQKVLSQASLQGVWLQQTDDQGIQQHPFDVETSWESPDTVLKTLLGALMEHLPAADRLTYEPQFYQWSEIQAFYQWKAQGVGSTLADWNDAYTKLMVLQEAFPGMARLIYPELAELKLIIAAHSNPVNQTSLEQAEQWIRQALEIEPQNDHYQALLAQSLYFQKKHHLAKGAAVVANSLNPQNASAQLIYGLAIVGRKQEETMPFLKRALQYNPFWNGDLLAELPAQDQRMLSIVEILQQAHVPIPQNSAYLEALELGKKSFQQQDWATAAGHFTDAINAEPTKLEPQLLLARSQISQNQYTSALELLNTMNQNFPDHERVLLYLGIVNERLQIYQDAEKAYRQSLFLDPQNAKTLLRLATVLIKLRQYEDAQSFLENLTQKQPSYTIAWWNLGLLYWKLKQWPEARNAWQQAAELDPDNQKYQQYLKRAQQRAP